MCSTLLTAVAGLIWIVLIVRQVKAWFGGESRADAAEAGAAPANGILSRLAARLALPKEFREVRVPPGAAEILDASPPVTPEEVERYVPAQFRGSELERGFARAKILSFTETKSTRIVGSIGGFDVAQDAPEEYLVFHGIYGYRDHHGRIHAFKMEPTENERDVRPGRSFIVCFSRKFPQVHHLFPMVRVSEAPPDRP